MTPLPDAFRPAGHRSSASVPAWLLPVLALAFTAYRAWVILHLDIDPYVDEAYYWGWAQALDWGYYSKPPLIAGLIALCQALFGDGLLALKAPSLILYPATALLVQQLGRRLFDARIGFWAGLAFLTMPIVSALGLFVSTDAPLLFFWALGMLLLWRVLQSGSSAGWLAVGVVAGLGMMSKYTMAAFVGSAFLALLAHPGGWRQLLRPGPWLALAAACAVFAPNVWWNWQHGFPTFQHTAEITRIGGTAAADRGWKPGEFFEFLGAQWMSFGPLLAIALAWALLHLRRLWADTRLRFLLMLVLPLLVVVGVQALTGRANGNWAAPIFVGGCILVPAFLAQGGRGRWRLAVAAVVLNLLLAPLAYHWPDLLRAAGKELTARNDPYKRARGWQAFSEAVRPYLAQQSPDDPDPVLLSDDRELLAQLIWHLRPARYARWQPQAHVTDHYGLTAPLTPQTGRRFLFVTDRADAGAIAARFGSADRLGEVDVAVYPKLHRRATVWLMRDFHGY
ncbi:ArnT family glycosyltransferase [Thauera sinica]|uniref:ArnT family glycosyltransferase n=1 Tax=Thauera sinica TaxID=2665146 RepID=A0ABW1APN3_9RHOO|nr:glycosyltransferase family 39 protein [Thauera sp. K11]ATE62303.1 glycosyl transferase family 39 [Thauera sp. K11]